MRDLINYAYSDTAGLPGNRADFIAALFDQCSSAIHVLVGYHDEPVVLATIHRLFTKVNMKPTTATTKSLLDNGLVVIAPLSDKSNQCVNLYSGRTESDGNASVPIVLKKFPAGDAGTREKNSYRRVHRELKHELSAKTSRDIHSL